MKSHRGLLGVAAVTALIFGTNLAAQSRPADFGRVWVRSHEFTLHAYYMLPEPETIPAYQACGMSLLSASINYGNNFFNQASPNEMGKSIYLPPTLGLEDLAGRINSMTTPTDDNAWWLPDEPGEETLGAVGQLAGWLRENRPNGLNYVNVYRTESAYLDQVMSVVQPDVLMYDFYPFGASGEDIDTHFSFLGAIRAKARQYGVPYFCWIQAFAGSTGPMPSESEMRMQLFSSLAAGYKGIGYWFYNGPFSTNMAQALLVNGMPTPMYYSVQAANAEVKHLGRYLRCLESTEYRFVPGAGHTPPSGISNWTPGAGGDPHITGLAVNSSGGKKDGLIGLFTDDYGNHFFLFQNLYRSPSLSAADATVSFTLTFDASVNHLYRINRDTGVQEVVPLTNHQLVLSLPGGTGDLFSYTGFTHLVPTGGIAIDGGAEYAYSPTATLSLSASGGTGALQMRFSNDWTTWSDWEPFAASKSWTLPSGKDVMKVWVQYRDEAGTTSPIYADTISMPPYSGTGPLYPHANFYEPFDSFNSAIWYKKIQGTNTATVEGELLIDNTGNYLEYNGYVNPSYANSVEAGEKAGCVVSFDVGTFTYYPSAWAGFYLQDRSDLSHQAPNRIGLAYRTKDAGGSWSWGWYVEGSVNGTQTEHWAPVVADVLNAGDVRKLEIERTMYDQVTLRVFKYEFGGWVPVGEPYVWNHSFAESVTLCPALRSSYVGGGDPSGFRADDLTIASYLPIVQVQGTVALGGYLGDPSVPVSVRVELSRQGFPVRVEQVTLDADGRFTIDNVTGGSYRIAIKAYASLGVVLDDVTVWDDPTILPPVTLKAGDYNGDNVVSFGDFSLLQNSYGQSGAAGANPLAAAAGGCGALGITLMVCLGLVLSVLGWRNKE